MFGDVMNLPESKRCLKCVAVMFPVFTGLAVLTEPREEWLGYAVMAASACVMTQCLAFFQDLIENN